MDEEHYSDEPKPLGEYTIVMAVFATAVAVFLGGRARSGRPLPERIPAADVVLLGLATHKISRLVSRSKIASPVRAPFTKFEGPAGTGEVEEAPRASGLRRAVGELLTCPYCLDVWVAVLLSGGILTVPRLTRLTASTFSIVAISDFLQQMYACLRARS